MSRELKADTIQTIMKFGRVVHTRSDGLTDEEHVAGLEARVRSTRINFEIGETSEAHGLGLAVMPMLQVAFVGNSPNSEAITAALCEAWNRLVDDVEDRVFQDEIASSMLAESQH